MERHRWNRWSARVVILWASRVGKKLIDVPV